jgi:hypothetical protein
LTGGDVSAVDAGAVVRVLAAGHDGVCELVVGRRQILDGLHALTACSHRALNHDGDALAEANVVEHPRFVATLADHLGARLPECLLEQRPGRLPLLRREAIALLVDLDAAAGGGVACRQ